jgi:hypothetical protein
MVQGDTSEEVIPLGIKEGPGEVDSQTVSFLDNAEGAHLVAPTGDSAIARVDGTDDVTLGAFLQRPTQIHAFVWATTDLSSVAATFQPWHLFLNNAAIKKKIDNFAFFRGKLHVKVVINGSPFQYGAMRLTYMPLGNLFADAKIRDLVTIPTATLIPYSQIPGFYFYPQANAGGEIELPFVYHKNWLNLTSALDLQDFGTCRLVIYDPLKVVSAGGSTTVTVLTYAWLTDVELMGPTSSLAVQGDEYNEGPISMPATALASIAHTLTHVPFIGRFARATEIGAQSIASIARLFGFTNVPVISDVPALLPMNAPMLASANIGTPIQKLTYDPKQELSIDPAMHGLAPKDELSLAYLKQKLSFFADASWDTVDLQDTVLFNMRITPSLFAAYPLQNAVPATVGQQVYHTPLSFIGEAFRHWRGGIKIRIKIVCTKFHKGRLKISYDPIGDISTISVDENLVYTEIVDIGEQDEIDIVIPYHQSSGWLDLVHDVGIPNWNKGGVLAPRSGIDNGLLTIRVLNSLVAPSSGYVTLLISVCGADDFEFANPSEHIGGDTVGRYYTPSILAIQADDHTELKPVEKVLGTLAKPDQNRYAMNFGEVVTSLRTVLHRTSMIDNMLYATPTANTYSTMGKVFRIMPIAPGFSGVNLWTSANKVLTAGSAYYTFSQLHPMNYFSSMFLGYRGSASITVTPFTDSLGSLSNFQVQRVNTAIDGDAAFFRYTTASPATTNARIASLNNNTYFQAGTGGMALTSTNTNGSLQFNLPFYSKYNFALTIPAAAGSVLDGTKTMAAKATAVVFATTDLLPATNFALSSAQCAGPDFTCLFFLCCPTLDYMLAEPVPT